MTAPTSTYKLNPEPQRRAHGSVSGTYTAASDVSTTANASIASGVLTITLGFVPSRVKVMNASQKIACEWFEGMNQGDYLKTLANGTVSLETGDALTITPETRAGAVGGTSSGGTADTAASGVVTFTFSGLLTDNETLVWEAVG
ncbi:MAG: hypothetical protein NUW01_01380 [Gemmatimonadaceae bacterium]|nr:hypothetical protein [Gemmatimonadaceae bacterium]